MSERPGGTAFIGFTYGGEHSIERYNIYRTSNGDRYDHNLIPQIADKVVDVPGGDGQYYFKTNYKTRQFSIPIAFDDLDQQRFDAMKKWLNGKEIKPLVFDERTEVTYSAKVTGTPQLKYVCFDDNGTNVYKGEGTIQFTCYFPFGWEQKTVDLENNLSKRDMTFSLTINGDCSTNFVLTIPNYTGGTLKLIPNNDNDSFEEFGITVSGEGTLVWDSGTGLVKIDDTLIEYSGTSYSKILGNCSLSITNFPENAIKQTSPDESTCGTFVYKELYY